MAQKLQEETEELAKDNTELIETYNKELEAVRDVINELNTLIETYGLAEQAAKDAAEEQTQHGRQDEADQPKAEPVH